MPQLRLLGVCPSLVFLPTSSIKHLYSSVPWSNEEHDINLSHRGAGTFTLLATHFQRLAELPRLYPNAKLWYLEVGTSRAALDFKWRLHPGAGDAAHYGLILARSLGFPKQVGAPPPPPPPPPGGAHTRSTSAGQHISLVCSRGVTILPRRSISALL